MASQNQDVVFNVDDPSFSSDHFRMFEFKIKRCSRAKPHDWTLCPFAHPGEKAKRRDPRRYRYSGTACPEFRKNNCCRRGDACPFAHGVFECWLHPSRYRTQLCTDGTNCTRRVCFFAHTPSELRKPEEEVNGDLTTGTGAPFQTPSVLPLQQGAGVPQVDQPVPPSSVNTGDPQAAAMTNASITDAVTQLQQQLVDLQNKHSQLLQVLQQQQAATPTTASVAVPRPPSTAPPQPTSTTVNAAAAAAEGVAAATLPPQPPSGAASAGMQAATSSQALSAQLLNNQKQLAAVQAALQQTIASAPLGMAMPMLLQQQLLAQPGMPPPHPPPMDAAPQLYSVPKETGNAPQASVAADASGIEQQPSPPAPPADAKPVVSQAVPAPQPLVAMPETVSLPSAAMVHQMMPPMQLMPEAMAHMGVPHAAPPNQAMQAWMHALWSMSMYPQHMHANAMMQNPATQQHLLSALSQLMLSPAMMQPGFMQAVPAVPVMCAEDEADKQYQVREPQPPETFAGGSNAAKAGQMHNSKSTESLQQGAKQGSASDQNHCFNSVTVDGTAVDARVSQSSC